MSSLFFVEGAIDISQFYNPYTLNIFCDASITGKYGNQTGCYGVVAVVRDEIVDSFYRLSSNTTNNESELKGLRAAIGMANKYKNSFKNINIFCDSQISIFSLRDYIYKWKYNPYTGLLYGTAGKPIANQNIIIESHNLLLNTCMSSNALIRLFHQSGHIDNKYDKLKEAALVFTKSNNVRGSVDLNFIRYISTYNNYVDQTSRSLLRNSNIEMQYINPISFSCQGKIKR